MPLWTKQRPPGFRLTPDQTHPLRRGLLFAMLGQHPKSFRAHDTSLFGNHGTLTNMDPTDWVWSEELGRWCLDLAASPETVVIPDSSSLKGMANLSVFMWMRARSAGIGSSYGRLISKSDQAVYSIVMNSSRTSIATTVNSTLAYATIADEAWNHVGFVYNGANITAYCGGVPGTPVAKTGAVSTVASNVVLGNRTSDLLRQYDGYLSDVLIFDRALSISEIQSLGDPRNTLLSIGNVPLILPEEPTVFPVAVADGTYQTTLTFPTINVAI